MSGDVYGMYFKDVCLKKARLKCKQNWLSKIELSCARFIFVVRERIWEMRECRCKKGPSSDDEC